MRSEMFTTGRSMGVAAAVLAGVAGAAFGGEDGDVGLLLRDGRLITALAVDDAGDTPAAFLDQNQRVFAGAFDGSGFADEPGFYTNTFGGFEVGQSIGYNNIGTLRVWNGAGFEDAVGNSLSQLVGPFTETVTGTSSGVREGFRFAYNGGEYDEHPDLLLGDTSAPGVFLWELSFFVADADGSIVASSLPAFIVLNFGVDEAVFDEAFAFATAAVPAPMGAGVLALAGVVASRRRR